MKYKKFKGEKETLCRLLGSAMYLDSSVYGGSFLWENARTFRETQKSVETYWRRK